MLLLWAILFKVLKRPQSENLCTKRENEKFDSDSGLDITACYNDEPNVEFINVTFQHLLYERTEPFILTYRNIFKMEKTNFFNCVFNQLLIMCISKTSLEITNTNFIDCYDYKGELWASLFQNHCPYIKFENVTMHFNDTQHGTRCCISLNYQEAIFNNVSIIHCEDYTGAAISVQDNLDNATFVINNCTIKESYTYASIIVDQKTDTIQSINITNCVFDDGRSGSNFCFGITSYSPELIVFKNNTIANFETNETLIGEFEFFRDADEFVIDNIIFLNNSCSPVYRGGSGILFFGVFHIIYKNCVFANNRHNQDKSSNRLDDNYEYLNGDGGAIQMGFDSTSSLMNLTFVSCSFVNNSCERNGGALALQTVSYIVIKNCSFISNHAGVLHQPKNQKEILSNYYHLKSGGRGGAIYINPYFNASTEEKQFPNDQYMKQITIEDCKFILNTADDGYAIYIEGDDKGTIFNIKNNVFISNLASKPSESSGAVIISEINSLQADSLKSTNDFKDEYNGALIKEFLLVNHSAKWSFETFAYYTIPATECRTVNGQFHKFKNRIGSSTSGSVSELTFSGVKFFVYGSYNNKYGKLIINLDGENLAIIDEGINSEKYSIDVLIFESPELEYMNHTINLICQDNKFIEVTRIVVQQCNSPHFIDVTELTGSNNWPIQASDEFHGHAYQSDNKENFLEFEINCSQFWILGDETESRIQIRLDESILSTNSLSNQNYRSLYASDCLFLNQMHKICLNPMNGLISIHGIMYTKEKPYMPININFGGDWSNAHQRGRLTKSGYIESYYKGTEFKIYGAILVNGCSIKIFFDDVEIATKSFTQSEFNIPNTLLFDSINEYKQPIEFGLHSISIEIANQDQNHDSIEINGIYCQDYVYTEPLYTKDKDGPKDKTAIIITGIICGVIVLASVIISALICACSAKPVAVVPIINDDEEEEEAIESFAGIDIESESYETV